MCTQIPQAGSRIHDLSFLFLNDSYDMSYGRAPRAVVLGAALALLLAATSASRGGPACQSAQAWPAWSGSIVPVFLGPGCSYGV